MAELGKPSFSGSDRQPGSITLAPSTWEWIKTIKPHFMSRSQYIEECIMAHARQISLDHGVQAPPHPFSRKGIDP